MANRSHSLKGMNYFRRMAVLNYRHWAGATLRGKIWVKARHNTPARLLLQMLAFFVPKRASGMSMNFRGFRWLHAGPFCARGSELVSERSNRDAVSLGGLSHYSGSLRQTIRGIIFDAIDFLSRFLRMVKAQEVPTALYLRVLSCYTSPKTSVPYGHKSPD